MDGASGQSGRSPLGSMRERARRRNLITTSDHHVAGSRTGDKLVDDLLLGTSSGGGSNSASPLHRPSRLEMPVRASTQENQQKRAKHERVSEDDEEPRRIGKMNLSDGRHSHYLDLDLDLDIDLALTTEQPQPTDGTTTLVSPLERFWGESQRHERIAFMMQQFETETSRTEPASGPSQSFLTSQPLSNDSTRIKPGAGLENSNDPSKDAGSREEQEDKNRKRPHKSSSATSPDKFFSGLDIEAELEVDEDAGESEMPDLEAIKIAARIKTEQIFRRGQRECRLGRVRKKISKAKKSRDETLG